MGNDLKFAYEYVGPVEEPDSTALDLANERLANTPDLNDTTVREYQTVGGAIVAAMRTAESEVSYTYCYGCSERRELDYGWDDRTKEYANKHAGECHARPVGVN
ncbi:hypothetical protein ACGFOM_18120 [Streptomyces sp. NPDC048594]|uniref:hypothetical protein n=1 Tax=Streptomyces sp. NPDC048594 TaxID=3365575 RepID=UPI00371AEE90